MNRPILLNKSTKWLRLSLPLLGGLFTLVAILWAAQFSNQGVHADAIEPPEGYPKFNTSVQIVNPTLAATGGEKLSYRIEIRNTGATMASGTLLTNILPEEVTYNNDALASVSPKPKFSDGRLTWKGVVGFDATVIIKFSVKVLPAFSGLIQNTAVISHPSSKEPVTVIAETMVTDWPVFSVEKTSIPEKPGPNKPLTYTLQVVNIGQPAINLPIKVIDKVPLNSKLLDVGPDGQANDAKTKVTWNRTVSLDTGQTTSFYFSVKIDDVLSGTVITNKDYNVSSAVSGISAGKPYTTTVVDPDFLLMKEVWPDPPGSNSEVTYTLTVLNKGSLATNLTVTDIVPDGVDYVSGGHNYNAGAREVSWAVARLDTNESTQLSYVVSIGDVADIPLINSDYEVCSEGVCQSGDPLTSTIRGATFLATAEVYPIAKKPGGGTGPVTPTLTIENLGPGNALNARALLRFEQISVSVTDLTFTPAVGAIVAEPDCGEKCESFVWKGDVDAGQTITFTTITGQSTIGGGEGTNYTATVVINDNLSNTNTQPITATASGKITHFANLIPIKTAPPIIGRGQLLTYDIRVWNSALSTDEPPFPVLTDTVPQNTTFVSASDGGVTQSQDDSTVVSWTLPGMSTGEELVRSFTVRVDSDLVSGTQIINGDYATRWYEPEASAFFSKPGEPVTTTVREVGLIDSYKEVTPTLALPGPGTILTFTIHVVNSSPILLKNVAVYDFMPWEWSTYQRDAVVSSGQIISDIVSLQWNGRVPAYSTKVIKFTVLVDDNFQGAITNTAVISHKDLQQDVVVDAAAYITDKPVLYISKQATVKTQSTTHEILYTILVENKGQAATELVIDDRTPAKTVYVVDSANLGGVLVDDYMIWKLALLGPGESRLLTFRVTSNYGGQIINDDYGVTSAEGVKTRGNPVVVDLGSWKIYLPTVPRQ